MDGYQTTYEPRPESSALSESTSDWQAHVAAQSGEGMGYYNTMQDEYSPVPPAGNSSFRGGHHQEVAQMAGSGDTLPQFHMVESSVGPARVLTRRQKAALSAREASTGRASGSRIPSQDANTFARSLSGYYVPPSASRPQTPNNNNLTGPTYQQLQHPLQHPIPSDPNSAAMAAMGSPQFPSHSPASSVSPAYSTYGFYQHPPHSRSNSISTSTNARSASPALSVASQRTSVSSSTSSGITFASLPQLPMIMSPTMPKPKLKKQRLFNVDRKQICEYHIENPNARQEDIAARFGVERSTISKILKHKTKWMNVPTQETLRVAKHRPSKFPQIESILVHWLSAMSNQDVILTDNLIREQAKDAARGLGISEDKFKASSGWVENFKHRHGVRRGVWHGEGNNTMTARAMGAGTMPEQPDGNPTQTDSALSPLNPAFASTHMETMDSHESPSNYEDDMSVQPEPTGNHWEPHPPPIPSHDFDNAQASSSSSSSAEVAVIQPRSLEVSPQTHQHPEGEAQLHHAHHAGVSVESRMVYDGSMDLYEQAPPEERIPSLDEANVALDTIISYVKSQGTDFLTMSENDVLARLKGVLFQAGNGLPFV